MANFVVETSPLTLAVRDMLVAAVAPDKVGFGAAPTGLVVDAQGRLLNPYVILYQVSAPVFSGSWAHPGDMADVQYQTTCVGGNLHSALVMRDRVTRAMVGRALNGGFERAVVTPAALSVMDRRIVMFGTPEAVLDLWQVPDTYGMEVQAHA